MKPTFSLSGMPDFSPLQIKKREWILSVIRQKFESFGFLPISTSSIEKRSNLFANYSADNNRLIFQILKSGNYLSKLDINSENITSGELSQLISDKALRYDLTIPFARFVADNKSKINFKYRRSKS